MKKFLCALFALVLTLSLAGTAFAFDPNEDSISPQHAILIDANTGAVLYEKNADDQAYLASTTKIMTCILALEKGDLDESVTVGEEVWRGFGSQSSMMGLSEGERVTLRELIYGLMLVSGNDAAAAIAVHLGGSISGFADMMNEKAAQLGMTGSHFVNPHGRHEDDHYTTARDLATLARYCMVQSPEANNFRAVVGRETYTVEPTNRDKDGYFLENSNKLIHTKEGKESYEYRYATGIKTGDTNQALRCLAASAEKDGISLICILLEDKENDSRFTVATNLFEWGFENLITVSAAELSLPAVSEVVVSNCSFDDPENGILAVEADLTGLTVTMLNVKAQAIAADPDSVDTEFHYQAEGIAAPVSKGQQLGTVTYRYQGEELFTAPLIASRGVAAMHISTSADPEESPTLSVGAVEQPRRDVSWIFWVLIVLVVIILVCMILRIINRQRIRRRRRRRVNYRRR